MKKLTFVLLAIALTTSCTIQKRLYNPGYSITWNKKLKSKDDTPIPSNEIASINESIAVMDTLSVESTGAIQLEDTLKKCDNIILNDGEEIDGMVTEITETEIKYRLCKNQSGPLRTVSKSKVLMVKYASGEKEIFKKEEPVKEAPVKTKKDRKIERLGLTGFILSMIGIPLWLLTPFAGFVFGPLCFIFGIVSLIKITRNQEKFRGAGFALISILLGLAFVMLALVFIL